MSAGKSRLRRGTVKDLCTVGGLVAIAAMILFSLPEVESDLPRGLVILVVCVCAAIFLVVRWTKRLIRGARRRPRGRQRSRGETHRQA